MSKPKKRTVKAKRVNWRAAAIVLAKCVRFSLGNFKHMKHRGTVFTVTGKSMDIRYWQDDFLDALDGIGYVLDRKAYYGGLDNPKKRRR